MENITFRYLPSNERDLAWGLAVSCVGFQRVKPGDTYPPEAHPASYNFNAMQGRVLDEYQLIYIVKGEGVFKSEHGGEHHVKAGDVELLFPGERHTYKPNPKTGWDEYWIGFCGPNIDTRMQNGFFNVNHPIFHIGIREEVAAIYSNAISAAERKGRGYQQLLSGCVNMLLGYLLSCDTSAQTEDDTTIEMMKRAIIYMNEHFCEDIHPEEVAEMVNCGYSRFRKNFVQYTGVSPYQHILQMRIRRSKELLMQTNMNLSEIAYDVGFNNSDYFSTAFKRIEKISPKQYRQQASFGTEL